MLRAFSSLRPLLLSLALLTTGGVVAVSVAEPAWAQRAWRTHKDSKYGYRVEFPGVPSQSQNTSPSGAVIDVVSLEAGTTGAFTVVAISGVTAEPAEALDRGTVSFTQAGKLLGKADLTVDGAAARDLTVSMPDSGMIIRVRLVVQGGNLFQVLATSVADTPLEGTDRFIDSFRLNPPPAATAPGTMAPVADD